MRYVISVIRRKDPKSQSFTQYFDYETSSVSQTVAGALIELNRGDLTDRDGVRSDPIAWECSCLQKKCGACAMVVNGIPSLACDSILSEVADKDGLVRLEPLRKFPVVRDLICDRSAMFENLKKIKSWLGENPDLKLKDDKKGLLFSSGKCLQCGCCLEVCPNFYSGGEFFGMSAAAPASGVLGKLPSSKAKEMRSEYSSHFYAGCGKSLACRDICPAKLPVEELMVNSNAVVLWKHLFAKE